MRFSSQRLSGVVLLVALFLFPGMLASQETQGAQSPAAATEQPSSVPELADLIPMATALSGRLDRLEKTIADVDLSGLEQQLRQVSAQLDEYARQLPALQEATGLRAGRLAQLKAEIESAGDALTAVSESVKAQVKTLGDLRKEWLAEQRRWAAWKAAMRKDESLEEVSTTFTKAQQTIDTALALLRKQLKPLLSMQEQAAGLQIRVDSLTAQVQRLFSLTKGGVLAGSPPMFSPHYFSQLAAALKMGIPGLVQISLPERSSFAKQAWVVILQGVLALVLTLVFLRHRHELEQVEHWRFIAKRPGSAGLLVGIVSVVAFYRHPPDMLLLVWSVLVASAFVRLLAGLVEVGWRRQFVYGLVSLVITTNIAHVLGLPLALFRLYILAAGLMGLLFCLHWAASSSHLGEARLYAWVLRLVAVLLAAVLFTELAGEAKLAEFLFVSSLRTLAIVLTFGLLRHVVRGALEWVVLRFAARGGALVSGNAAVVVQRLGLVFDTLIGAVILSGLFMVWQVYGSPTEAIARLLSAQVTVGSQQITVGLVVVAIALFGVSYVVSWILQKLLTKNVLAKRNVETGVSYSIARLVHYSLITTGFVIALVVLGVDLTKMTLLASALGVGIGFGLQTIVNNFVCGLILLFERPLRVGDTVELGGRLVKIARIGLRSTTVLTLDRADVIVPNADLITNQVTNWTLTDRHARGTVPVGVAYGSDVPLVMKILKECALAQPGIMKDPEPEILFRSFGDSSLNFELRAWIADIDNKRRVESDLNQEIDRRFRQVGIEIPFPQRDLHVRSGEILNTVPPTAITR